MGIQMKQYITKRWNVGGGLRFFSEIMSFNSFMVDFYGIQGPVISSVYDSHAGLRWNGGRYIPHFPFSLEESIRRVRAYNNLGIGFNITFSNNQLSENDFQDEDCNWFLEQCESLMNSVIVSSHMLKNYIRENYPAYKIVASIGFNRKDPDFYQDIQHEYDMMVLHPDLNQNLELIKRLDVSKLEVLVNEYCKKNCEFRTQHSEFISKLNKKQTTYLKRDHTFMNGRCMAVGHDQEFHNELILSWEEVDRLNKFGVQHFKIQGREHDYAQVLKKALHTYIMQGTIRELLAHLM